MSSGLSAWRWHRLHQSTTATGQFEGHHKDASQRSEATLQQNQQQHPASISGWWVTDMATVDRLVIKRQDWLIDLTSVSTLQERTGTELTRPDEHTNPCSDGWSNLKVSEKGRLFPLLHKSCRQYSVLRKRYFSIRNTTHGMFTSKLIFKFATVD